MECGGWYYIELSNSLDKIRISLKNYISTNMVLHDLGNRINEEIQFLNVVYITLLFVTILFNVNC